MTKNQIIIKFLKEELRAATEEQNGLINAKSWLGAAFIVPIINFCEKHIDILEQDEENNKHG